MRIAYFSEFSMPGQDRIARAYQQLPAAQRARLETQRLGAPAQDWDAVLAQQQAIYDELVANHELSGATQRVPHVRHPTTCELTRDLAGWTRPATTPARTSFYPSL